MQFYFLVALIQIILVSADERQLSVYVKQQVVYVNSKAQEIIGNLQSYRNNFEQVLKSNHKYEQNVAEVKFHEIENGVVNYALYSLNQASIFDRFSRDYCFNYAKVTAFMLHSISKSDLNLCIQDSVDNVDPHLSEVDNLIIAVKGLMEKLKSIPQTCRTNKNLQNCAKQEVQDLRDAMQKLTHYAESLQVTGGSVNSQATLTQDDCKQNTMLNMEAGAVLIKSATQECIQRKQYKYIYSFN